MRFYICAIVSVILLTSCISLSTERVFVNKEGYSISPKDIKIDSSNTYRFVAEPVDYYLIQRNSVFPDTLRSFIYLFEFTVYNEDIFEINDSFVILHSFSFTTSKGDTIPYTLFYRDTNYDANLLQSNSFPINITEDMMINEIWKGGHSYGVFAECHMPRGRNSIYVNYDIEVGENRYLMHSRWRIKKIINFSRLGHG